MLGFGSAPDTIPVGHPPLPPTFSPVGVAVPKRDADEPSQQGQFGVAFRFFAEGLGGTDFGFYFINYHSRLPLIMAQTGTANGILVTGNYAATASYFLTYPEDIKLIGASFNTQLGRTGIALQGEVSHRRDLPLQLDDVELLYAALGPLRLLPAIPQLAPIRAVGTLLASTNQIGAFGFSEVITGYKRFNTTQLQVTATKAFSRILGADQMVLVGETAWGTVHDLPDQSVLRLEAPGTYTTGNPVHQTAGIQPGTEPSSAFPTSKRLGVRPGRTLRIQQCDRRGEPHPALLLCPGRERRVSGPGRELHRGTQGVDGRARLPVPHQVGVGRELQQLLRGGPLQPAERPRLPRGQHQVHLLRQTSCAFRHDSSRPSLWPRWPFLRPSPCSRRRREAASAQT
jgi:hypothetical protein